MKKDEEIGGMWCLVMFDLPVGTNEERRRANEFRHLLLDLGYMMVQFSVYARYTPTQSGNRSTVKEIKANLPPEGHVRILHVSDHQWSRSLRFYNHLQSEEEEPPGIATVF